MKKFVKLKAEIDVTVVGCRHFQSSQNCHEVMSCPVAKKYRVHNLLFSNTEPQSTASGG